MSITADIIGMLNISAKVSYKMEHHIHTMFTEMYLSETDFVHDSYLLIVKFQYQSQRDAFQLQ